MQDESFIFNTPTGRKAINITPCDSGALVRVDHPIFGAWQFVLPVAFDAAVYGVTQMYRGELVQDAFPDLNAEQRELFLTNPAHDMFDDGRENCAECGDICDNAWKGYDGVYCSYHCLSMAEPEGDDDNT